MNTVTVDIIVKAGIKDVWDFFTDVRHLEMVCPPDVNENVIMATHDKFQEGSELWTATDYLGSRVWHSKITKFKDFEYVDEVEEGLFNKWIHSHKFEEISEGETRIVERVDFDLFHGVIGKIVGYLLSKKVKSFLSYRARASKNILEFIHDK